MSRGRSPTPRGVGLFFHALDDGQPTQSRAPSGTARGWISLWAGSQDDAIADFDKALRLSPFDQGISTYSLGRSFALTMSGRDVEGLRWARRAIQENPEWTASYRGLAAGLVCNGKLEEARTVAAKLMEIDPSFHCDGGPRQLHSGARYQTTAIAALQMRSRARTASGQYFPRTCKGLGTGKVTSYRDMCLYSARRRKGKAAHTRLWSISALGRCC
jgi:tetratricopeptide (TPR) repeat protein